MKCYKCKEDIKNQGIKYHTKFYDSSLGIIMSNKGIPKELINIIISFLVNEKGHRIMYQKKNEFGLYLNHHSRVCDPCFLYRIINSEYTKGGFIKKSFGNKYEPLLNLWLE